MYTLFDPPVSPFSPPAAIQAWIEHLEQLGSHAEYAAPEARKELDSTLRQAREWLTESLKTYGDGSARRSSSGGR